MMEHLYLLKKDGSIYSFVHANKSIGIFQTVGLQIVSCNCCLGTAEMQCVCVSVVFFFFFFTLRGTFQCFLMNSVYYLWNPQTFFFNKIFIKNRSYGTIHTFKNYFTIMFSVFNFQQNKRYSNGSVHLETAYLAEKLEIENFLLKIPQIKLKSS